jgi:predicted MPP superfamily phosphohydrolase
VKRISRRRFLGTLGLSGAGVVGLSGYGFAVEPMWRLEVTRHRVTPTNWPRELKLSIAVIADLHAGGPTMPLERIHGIVENTNALTPDIVVLLGVHAILGNHDWWDDRAAQRNRRGPVLGRRMLEREGVPVYENDVVRLVHQGRPFWLAGLGDQLALVNGRNSAGRRRFEGVHDLWGALAKVTDDAPVILLAHEPDIFPSVPPRVSLTLSGHTHGGQVRLLGYSPMVPSRFGNRYAYGHVVEDDRHLVISGGLGCSILPVRIGVPPEIVMVDVAAA